MTGAGAWPDFVDLIATERWLDGEVRWRSATTGRDLREMRHGAQIREALERRVVGAATAGIDLQLSGHAHGGQLLPLGWLSRLFEPRVASLTRFGATWLYVSEGTAEPDRRGRRAITIEVDGRGAEPPPGALVRVP